MCVHESTTATNVAVDSVHGGVEKALKVLLHDPVSKNWNSFIFITTI